MSGVILRHTFAPPNNSRLGHLCGPLDAHLRRIAQFVEMLAKGEKIYP